MVLTQLVLNLTHGYAELALVVGGSLAVVAVVAGVAVAWRSGASPVAWVGHVLGWGSIALVAFACAAALHSYVYEFRCGGPRPRDAIYATHDLAAGVTIRIDDVREGDRPPGAVVPEEVLENIYQALGRVPSERILAGEMIREERLAEPEAGVGLRAVLPADHGVLRVHPDGPMPDVAPGNTVDLVGVRRTVRSVLVLGLLPDGDLEVAVPKPESTRVPLGPVRVVLVGDAEPRP